MRRLLAVAAALLLGTALPAGAGASRQVILLVTEGRGYPEALHDPTLGRLAGAGGIGLMTTAGEETPAAGALTLGAGRAAPAAPEGSVRFQKDGDGLVVDVASARAVARPAVVGLLGTTLAAAGREVGYLDLRGARGDPAMLAAMDAGGRIPLAALNEFPTLGALPPAFLAHDAGPVAGADVVVTPQPDAVSLLLERSEAAEVLVLAVPTAPTEEMRAAGDTVLPAVLGIGPPARLLAGGGRAAGLTSDTTRRDGLISNVDVAPTVLGFLGVGVPGEMVGASIRPAGEPPTSLHRRAVRWRSVVTPIGVGALIFALVALLAGLALLAVRRVSPGPARVVAVAGLTSVAMLVMLVPAAVLPAMTIPVVGGGILAGGVVLTAVALRADRGGGRRAVTVVALTGLAAVVADAILGWPTGLTPFLGGSALDGERFFGLGNPYAGIVLAGAVLGASRLSLPAGGALLGAATLFAGMPFLGADLGGGLTLAIATGLWLGMSRWGRLDWRTLALGAVLGGIALGVFVVSHAAFPPGTTHVSRAVEGSGGVIGVLEVWWRRLLLNLETTSATPAVWLALLGLPAWLAILYRRPAPLRPALEDERWRWGVLVLAVSGIVGYLLNDTYGMAAVAFVFLTAAVVFPALWVRARTPATASPGG